MQPLTKAVLLRSDDDQFHEAAQITENFNQKKEAEEDE
jgi:hypothetical protein